MNITDALFKLLKQENLSAEEMQQVMHQIMTGAATPAQIGGFLVALRAKGETVDEIVGAVKVMRALATPVHVNVDHLVDTCGTGGDGAHTLIFPPPLHLWPPPQAPTLPNMAIALFPAVVAVPMYSKPQVLISTSTPSKLRVPLPRSAWVLCLPLNTTVP